MFGVRRRATEIHAEMLQDLDSMILVTDAPAIQKVYLETRLMVLQCQTPTRSNRKSIRAIRWLLESLVAWA